MAGFLALSQDIDITQSQPYDISLALRAPAPILLRVRVSSKENGGAAIANARVRLVGGEDTSGGGGEGGKIVLAEGMSSIKGYAEFNVQRADLQLCMVEVYKEGWAPGQGVMPSTLSTQVHNTSRRWQNMTRQGWQHSSKHSTALLSALRCRVVFLEVAVSAETLCLLPTCPFVCDCW